MSDGVLVMGFGGPRSLDDVPEFCANLMGREPGPEVLERVRLRYLTIGGSSPLPDIATSIAQKLGEKLAADAHEVPVKVGMRYWHPFMAEGIDELAAAGVGRVVTVSLSPFESSHSSGAYRTAVARAAAGHPDLTIADAPSIRTAPTFLTALTDALQGAVTEVEGRRKGVIFTAHSLPVAELGGDPYVEELREAAAHVARDAGLAPPAAVGGQRWLPRVDAYGSGEGALPWLLAYQSKGQRSGRWLGPDVTDVVREMAAAGFDAVVFSPIGFATDHMETLYDLDVEAAGLAYDLDMDFRRAEAPNDSELTVEALASVVEPLLA